jgi:tetratricopeptide (TPR) repeat protein
MNVMQHPRTRRRQSALAALIVCAAIVRAMPSLHAADQWIEVKSAHFTVTSNAGQAATRDLAWQLEQIRSAIAALWPWARVDLNKPLAVIAVKDEAAMKAMAPEFWERKGGVHPASVWVGGADQNYLAIRTDVHAEDTQDSNPYQHSYFSYAALVLQQSATRDLPFWFNRGLAGVISNTIVRDGKILLGLPIQWHLDRLREGMRWKIPALIKIDDSARELLAEEGLARFDAEAWAFVHFLMFGEGGARWKNLDRFSDLAAGGMSPDLAFREALGRPESLDAPFVVYIGRSLLSYKQVNLDASVKREGFVVRPLPAAESASRRALFHVAMQRPVEARAAIAEARQSGAPAPESIVAEALMLDRDGKNAEAKAAFAQAVEAGSTSPYAHYRLASLSWRPDADHDTLVAIDKALEGAVNLNTRDAAAYAFLGQTRAVLGTGDPVALVRRAVSLEPWDARHHVDLAFVLSRGRKYDEALSEAQAALTLAKTDEERQRATTEIESVTRQKRQATAPSSSRTASPASAATPTAAAADDTQPAVLIGKCQGGDVTACSALLPIAEAECANKNGQACGTAGWLYEHGRGSAIDLAKAAGFYRQSCDAGEKLACVAFATMQAHGTGVAKDEPAAISVLQSACDGGQLEGCTQLGVLLAAKGRPADITRARQVLTTACKAGHDPACQLLKSFSK